jgi:hypothetical protein
VVSSVNETADHWWVMSITLLITYQLFYDTPNNVADPPLTTGGRRQ